jgi:disulfide oxidoreductase YuzD
METCRGKRKGINTTFPNWKLVSKNRKQWMKKPLRIKYDRSRFGRTYVDITW